MCSFQAQGIKKVTLTLGFALFSFVSMKKIFWFFLFWLQVGTICAFFISGLIVDAVGWEACFYIQVNKHLICSKHMMCLVSKISLHFNCKMETMKNCRTSFMNIKSVLCEKEWRKDFLLYNCYRNRVLYSVIGFACYKINTCKLPLPFLICRVALHFYG